MTLARPAAQPSQAQLRYLYERASTPLAQPTCSGRSDLWGMPWGTRHPPTWGQSPRTAGLPLRRLLGLVSARKRSGQEGLAFHAQLPFQDSASKAELKTAPCLASPLFGKRCRAEERQG